MALAPVWERFLAGRGEAWMRPDPMPPALAAARVESKLALLEPCFANLVGELDKSVLRWLVRAWKFMVLFWPRPFGLLELCNYCALIFYCLYSESKVKIYFKLVRKNLSFTNNLKFR